MRRVIGLAIVAVTLLAWAFLFHLSRQMSAAAADETMMAAMGMAMNAPWTRTDFLLTFVMWTVMMVGMMAPSVDADPVARRECSAVRKRRGIPPAFLFGAGYLLVWVGFSAIATVAQWLLHDGALLSPAMAASSPRVAGAILIGAGLYQLTPLKNMCLTHCRSPIDFLMSHWRGGRGGRDAHGRASRRVLPRLLLGADGGALRRGRDEPGVGRGARAARPGREDRARRGCRFSDRWRRLVLVGVDHARLERL